MKKVYETPELETLRYVFSQPVAVENDGYNNLDVNGLLGSAVNP